MSAEASSAVAVDPKARSPQGAKGKSPRKAKETKETRTKKTAVYLSPESLRRLGAACVCESKSQSEIVEFLITHGLASYRAFCQGDGIFARNNDRTQPDAGVSQENATAA
jgi:hypothetical protein